MRTTRTSGRRALRALAASAALGLSLTTGAAVATPAPSGAGTPPPTPTPPGRVVADDLASPFGLAAGPAGSLFVAEAGAGQVTRVDRSGATTVALGNVPGVAGVASRGRYLWSVLGGPQEPEPEEDLRIAPSAARGVAPAYGPTSVLRTDLRTGRTVKIADLEDYELANNPDGQAQSVDGVPVQDALSNPFSMTLTPRGLLVADGGANDVLRVNPWNGKVSTFYVPPNPTTPECLEDGAQANPGTVGCDSVPTGVAFRAGSVFVSTWGSGAPGAGAVYRLSDRTGQVQRTWKGLDVPTGVAANRGFVFYGQPFTGAIVRIPRGGGAVAEASYPTPVALLHARGRLYASVGSLGPSGAVYVVPRSAFSSQPR